MSMKKDHERIGVKISIVGSALLASSAIVISLIAKSQAILLDAFYSFITLAMAFVSLKVIDLVRTPETKNRPFGYMALEPLLNLVKSLITLTLLTVFFITNIQEIYTGGRIVSLDIMSIYVFVCLIIYATIIWILRKYRRETNSSILALEIKNWYVDALITVGIAVSLFIAMIVFQMGHTKILPYIDPTIVILLITASFSVPLKTLLVELKRLLLVSSENNIEVHVKKQLRKIIRKYGLHNVQVWGLKSGRTHYLFIYSSLKEEQTTIKRLDEIRAEIFEELSNHYSKFWADIMFTAIEPRKSIPKNK